MLTNNDLAHVIQSQLGCTEHRAMEVLAIFLGCWIQGVSSDKGLNIMNFVKQKVVPVKFKPGTRAPVLKDSGGLYKRHERKIVTKFNRKYKDYVKSFDCFEYE